jgi:hypothetical protein
MAGAPPVVEGGQDYPLTFAVDYPDRELNRLTTFFRIFTVIPIALVFAAVGHVTFGSASDDYTPLVTAGGLLFAGPLLMLLFRKKYPVWWANWNRELLRFGNRVETYFALMNDQYPSTDEEQWVHLDFPTPDGERLSRGLPLVKWFLAIPHYVVLFFLTIAAVIAVILAWFAILFTGRYPRGMFEFVEGVIRWHNRVIAYMLILVTDRYPPFSLQP